MRTSNRSVSHPCSKRVSATSRTAVYGPVRTVVWEGRSRKAPPYPDLWPLADVSVRFPRRPLPGPDRTWSRAAQDFRSDGLSKRNAFPEAGCHCYEPRMSSSLPSHIPSTAKLVPSALDLIGHTPLVALDRIHRGPGRILAKAEFMQPG